MLKFTFNIIVHLVREASSCSVVIKNEATLAIGYRGLRERRVVALRAFATSICEVTICSSFLCQVS